MISFVIPYFEDTKERAKNIDIITQYYGNIFPTSQIIIESGTEPIFNKSSLYNNGFKKATNNIICFLDSDVLVSKSALEKSIALASDNNNVVVGYSGVAIYLTYLGKDIIGHLPTYDSIIDKFDDLKYKNYNKNTIYYELGNSRAVGGCLLMNKQCFTDINGYNPNFLGWGYEDNEVVLRSHKLKKNVIYVNNPFSYLLHLPHHDIDIDKSKHVNYSSNYNEYNKIKQLSCEEINLYKTSWKI